MPMLEQTVAAAVAELLPLTGEDDEDRRWELISWLHGYGGRPALDAATRLSGHPEPSHRQAAADIVSQLAAGPRGSASEGPYRDEALALLLSMVEHEQDPQVLGSITTGFGHIGDERCLVPLARLHVHPDATVRFGVAHGLLWRPEPAALDLLITLSADSDADVRDWATFGLGQSEQDFPRLRDALAARLSDDDPDTLAEAVVGLSLRGDTRAMPALLAALEVPPVRHGVDLTTEALYAMAAATADPRLHRHLTADRDARLRQTPDDEAPPELRAAVVIERLLRAPGEQLPEELLAALARYPADGEPG
ncbi:HEAT repeat domain-containing protein [Catellatospora aurea]|uniref:HEAT repeat domain-containing protein n=1 Tax=Catellatospora aurea TaxID=1337874 RepID=A0ABW2H388_9ACTN